MPKITAISFQTKNKKRCNIFVDGEFFSGVSIETVYKNRLKVGLEIDEKSLRQIISENERLEALNKAVEYLSKSIKTKRQIKDFLLKKGYEEDVVWQVIDKLKEYNYVNDCEYSKRYIESVSKNQGKKLIEYKLMMKGVKKEEISSAFDQSEIDLKESAKTVAEKYLKNKEFTKENKAKAYRYLISRGFSYEEANYALSNFGEDE